MSKLDESVTCRQSIGRRSPPIRSSAPDTYRARIENNVLHSPFPAVDIPECSVYKALKRLLLAGGENAPWSAAVVDSRRSLSRPALLHMMERYAAGFQRLGVHPGVHVCVHLRNNVQCMAVIFGIIFAGGTVILSNVMHKRHELLYRMRDGEATFVVTDLKNSDKVGEVCDELKLPEENRLSVSDATGFTCIAGFDTLEGEAFVEPAISDPRNTIAALVYTSGTTGLPRGVEITHYSFVANLFQNRAVLMPDEADVYLAWSPLTHVSGFLFTMLLACNGFTCVITAPHLTTQKFLDICDKHKVSWVLCFPTRMQHLMRNMTLMGFRLPSVRTLVVGGSAVPDDVIRMARAVFPGLRSMCNLYALNEACGCLTAAKQSDIGSIDLGVPTPNVQLKFVNMKTRETVGPMEHGEIAFRSPAMMRGYYKRPEETAQVVDSDGWCLTGDLGYYDKSGRVHLVERLKELIKTMDNQVVPGELEDLIREKCPEVGEVGVVGLPDPVLGEVPAAFVVLTEEGKGRVTEADIKKAVSDNLAAYKRLGAVYFCDFLPHSETGKVRRSTLREDQRFRYFGSGSAGAITPESPVASGVATPTDDSPEIHRGRPSTHEVH